MGDETTIQRSDDEAGRVIEAVVMAGNIISLSPRDRARYYVAMCESLGLNPLTQPIRFIEFQQKLVPYFTRDTTDQIAAQKSLTREIVDGPRIVDVGGAKLLFAMCRVTMPSGRAEQSSGYVPLPQGAEAICNALLKSETKAKRRGTLSICGLGFIDESELDTMPGARRLTHVEVMESTPEQLARLGSGTVTPPRQEAQQLDAPREAPAADAPRQTVNAVVTQFAPRPEGAPQTANPGVAVIDYTAMRGPELLRAGRALAGAAEGLRASAVPAYFARWTALFAEYQGAERENAIAAVVKNLPGVLFSTPEGAAFYTAVIAPSTAAPVAAPTEEKRAARVELTPEEIAAADAKGAPAPWTAAEAGGELTMVATPNGWVGSPEKLGS